MDLNKSFQSNLNVNQINKQNPGFKKRVGITAAGVLPISIDPDGKIVLLLGKEAIDDSGKSIGWSGFGGKLENYESPEEGAAREFEEESMALWMSKEEMYLILTTNKDKRLISRYIDGRYQEFVVYFPYSEKIPKQFDRVLSYFSKCSFQKCPEGHLEKTEVQWVRLLDLIEKDGTSLKKSFRVENRFERLRPIFQRTLQLSYPHIICGINNS